MESALKQNKAKELQNRLIYLSIPVTMLASLAMVFFRPELGLNIADKIFIVITAVNSSLYLSHKLEKLE